MARTTNGQRVAVVVELTTRPRARDVLWAGVGDCIASAWIDQPGTWGAGSPWGDRGFAQPSELPVMCVGYATARELAAWCEDTRVRSVEPWQ